ncbi:hypothetical protein LTR78_010049 [Recurvomyces mirabilis]|uniref:Uncharacterized protein n=1 Tax=Recurvomyces mirabilis TaxID=574656 RepID=A0AAE0TMZ0_9PEZI|nr:hypothetical protein LTR78_010049 [Recurvomyces mirabilis]KAK5149830.1 hypothetical protein LTS14_010651 [Recurvomyces mirabilis]
MLESYDCVKRMTDTVHEVEPYVGTFIRGMVEGKKSKGKSGKKDDEDASSIFLGDASSHRLTPVPTTSAKPSPTHQSSFATSPPQPSSEPNTPVRHDRYDFLTPSSPSKACPSGKKKLMGQSLILPPDSTPTPEIPLGRDEGAIRSSADFAKYNKELARLRAADSPTKSQLSSGRNIALSDRLGNELMETVDDAQTPPSTPFTHPRAAPVAHMTSSTTEEHCDDVEELVNVPNAEGAVRHVEGEPLLPVQTASSLENPNVPDNRPTSLEHRQDHNMRSSQSSSRAPSQSAEDEAEELRTCQVTVEDIRARLPAEGITIAALRESFGPELVPQNKVAARTFLHLIKTAATPKDGKYYLKTTASSQRSSQPAPSPVKQSEAPSRTEGSDIVSLVANAASDKAASGQAQSEPTDEVSRTSRSLKIESTASSVPVKRQADITQQNCKTKAAEEEAIELDSRVPEEHECVREDLEERELAMLQQKLNDDDEEHKQRMQVREQQAETLRQVNEAIRRAEEAIRAGSVE